MAGPTTPTAPAVSINSIEVDKSTVRCSIDYSDGLARFFTGDDFYAQYSVDISEVPESILVLPVLAHVSPVAWANGADVHTPVVDRRFQNSLRMVQWALKGMYPEFMTGGELHPERIVDTAIRNGTATGDSGLLFSGGVDSITTYIQHREEDPTLISIHGWTVEGSEEWTELSERLSEFGDNRGVENVFVESNMRSFIDTPMLHAHFKRYLVGSWYSGVGHGIGLLGLAAPVTHALGLDRLYMSATHTERFQYPWGSHPQIENQVAWNGTQASHEGYELGRQDKMGVIADFIREEDPDLQVMTCNTGRSHNCNRCEKCCRTAAGFILEGIDPNDHGYQFGPETYAHMREQLESGNWIIDENHLFMWEDIKRSIDPDREFDSPEATEFFQWLSSTDVDEFVKRLGPSWRGQLVHTVARNTPNAVYSTLYPLYDSVKETTGDR